MNLTRDYKPVLASFDRPQKSKVVEDQSDWDEIHVIHEFKVGFIVYQVELVGSKEELEVTFEIDRITGTNEQFRAYLSQVRRKEISIKEIPSIKKRILEYPAEDWEVGNSIAVFSTVLNIIKEVVDKHGVECLTFSATSDKKGRVYQKIFQSFFKGWHMELIPGIGGHTFELCRT